MSRLIITLQLYKVTTWLCLLILHRRYFRTIVLHCSVFIVPFLLSLHKHEVIVSFISLGHVFLLFMFFCYSFLYRFILIISSLQDAATRLSVLLYLWCPVLSNGSSDAGMVMLVIFSEFRHPCFRAYPRADKDDIGQLTDKNVYFAATRVCCSVCICYTSVCWGLTLVVILRVGRLVDPSILGRGVARQTLRFKQVTR